MLRGYWRNPGFWYFWALLVFLYLPIVILIIFSFNNSPLLIFPLKGFTLQWYASLLRASELLASVRNSLLVGLLSSLLTTIIGTMMSIAVMRYRFRGRNLLVTVASFPLVIPYVVLGVALLILFDLLGVKLSLATVTLGHVVISLPYVILIVSARLAGFPASLEEAAMDLGASYGETLLRVTIPICWPAIVSALLTSFTTSFDEFAVSFFLVGTESTLPVYLYSQLRFPSRLPLIVTLTTVIILASILILAVSEWLRRRGLPQLARGDS